MSSARSVEKPTSDFKDTLDYKEAYANRDKGPIHIGSLQGSIGKVMDKDILAKEEKSEYFGKVFCPNRKNRNDYDATKNNNWTYEKNMAFMAGAIDARRSVILTTNIEWYGKLNKIGVTNDEILWLADNGYTFKPNPKNPEESIAEPGQAKDHKIAQFRDRDGDVLGECRHEMMEKVNHIKNNVIAQREPFNNAKIGTTATQTNTQRDAIAEMARLQKAGKFVTSSLRKLADEQKKEQNAGTSNASAPVAQSQVTSTKTHIQSYQQSNTASIAKKLFGPQATSVLTSTEPIVSLLAQPKITTPNTTSQITSPQIVPAKTTLEQEAEDTEKNKNQTSSSSFRKQ